MIPKIIHYCWFGGKDMPREIKDCVATWDKLKGYEIKRWDESNCSFSENEFVKKAYAEKRWAFVSDYYRLKALKEYGGIYLDTDVKIHKNLDKLLKYKFFIGYMVDCCLGTAVFGAEKDSTIINDLLHMYDIVSFVNSNDETILWEYNKEIDKLTVNSFEENNHYFMRYFIRKYPNFGRKNKFQILDEGVVVYPKEYFEIGSLLGKHYTVHSWLYDVLFELEKRVDLANYNTYQRRVFGFLAERLFNIWLVKNIEDKDIAEINVAFSMNGCLSKKEKISFFVRSVKSKIINIIG